MPSAGGVRSLSQAVRPRVVGRWLGELLRAASLTVLPPLAIGLARGELRVSLALAAVGLVLLAVGAGLRRLGGPTRLHANEGLVVTSLTFALVAAAMSAPFAASGLPLPAEARVSHLLRDGELRLASADTRLVKGDQVVVVTHARHLDALRERFAPKAPGG